MTVYVTKYALTEGILEFEAQKTHVTGMIRVSTESCSAYYHGSEWHLTKDAAKTRAEQMRLKKIASLERKLSYLKSLKFN